MAVGSSPQSIFTRKARPPKRTSWPSLTSALAMRWPSTKVPLTLPLSVTVHTPDRRSKTACCRETEGSFTT
jgi:hypothetical protein